jgi:hypothetical protein
MPSRVDDALRCTAELHAQLILMRMAEKQQKILHIEEDEQPSSEEAREQADRIMVRLLSLWNARFRPPQRHKSSSISGADESKNEAQQNDAERGQGDEVDDDNVAGSVSAAFFTGEQRGEDLPLYPEKNRLDEGHEDTPGVRFRLPPRREGTATATSSTWIIE